MAMLIVATSDGLEVPTAAAKVIKPRCSATTEGTHGSSVHCWLPRVPGARRPVHEFTQRPSLCVEDTRGPGSGSIQTSHCSHEEL